MKIGILTYHRTLNYGACLQAVATRVVLEKMGHEVYYVDYWPKYHQDKYKTFSWNSFIQLTIKGKIWYLRRALKIFRYNEKRRASFVDFHNKYIIPYCRTVNDVYDVVVYGSDQIWRKQTETKQYNSVYFGDNAIQTDRHIAFSASMGLLPKSVEDKELVKTLVSHFSKISVRENDLKELLQEMGFTDVSRTLDPTLLLSKEEWNSAIKMDTYTGERYVRVYTIAEYCEFDMNEIRNYALKNGCKVKVLCGTALKPQLNEFYTTSGPDEFVNLIRNAFCVFTTSFHGLAFSIIYQREFFASYKKNSNRAKTLLDALEINGRLLAPKSKIPSADPIDYRKVSQRIAEEKLFSVEYLKSL